MKKTTLALALLGAFAGAASAQSVTLYGRFDTTVVWNDQGREGNADGGSRIGLNGNAPIGGSRWGMRGSEDLGGGLKVNFVLESGISSDVGSAGNSGTSIGTGTSVTRLFDRQAWVGLVSASLGELRLGRTDTLTRQLNTGGFTDITNEGELNVVETIARNGGTSTPLFYNFGSRVDNAVTYLSPSFSGFQVRAQYAFDEEQTASQYGVMLAYSAGPLKVGVVYETFDDAPDLSDSYTSAVTVGGSYKFGFGTVSLGYQDVSDYSTNITTIAAESGIDTKAYSVGLLVPFGNFEFRAQYIAAEYDTPGGDIDSEKYGVSLRYALSKRTQLYAVLTDRTGDDDETYNKTTEFAFGIGHNF